MTGSIGRVGAAALCATLAVSCTAASQASFALSARSCEANPAACQQQCDQSGGRDVSCEILLVDKAEALVARQDAQARELPGVADGIHALCQRDAISRACSVEPGLKALLAKQSEARDAKVAAANAEAHADADRANRVADARSKVQAVEALLQSLGRTSVSTADARLALDNADRCLAIARSMRRAPADPPPCEKEITEAERQADHVKEATDAFVAARQADKDRAANAQAQADAINAAWHQTNEACKTDLRSCKATCAKDAKSNECAVIALHYEQGDEKVIVGDRNVPKARAMMTSACGGGNDVACALLTTTAKRARECSNQDAAPATCKAYCDAHFGDACTALATLYINGNGVPADTVRANGLLKTACDYGSPSGCQKLGIAYHDGLRVPRNPSTSEEYFRLACVGSDQVGCAMYQQMCLAMGNCVGPVLGHADEVFAGRASPRPDPGTVRRVTCQSGTAHEFKLGCYCYTNDPNEPGASIINIPDHSCEYPVSDGNVCVIRCL